MYLLNFMKNCSHYKKNGFGSKADVNKTLAVNIYFLFSIYLEVEAIIHNATSVPTILIRQYSKKHIEKLI